MVKFIIGASFMVKLIMAIVKLIIEAPFMGKIAAIVKAPSLVEMVVVKMALAL